MKKTTLFIFAVFFWGMGTGKAQITDIYNFDVTTGDNPYYNSVTKWGDTLYGMVYAGGIHSFGLVFSVQTNGSNYKDLWDFNANAGTNGCSPYADLTLSGNTLYGMTSTGGVNSWGEIFSIKTNGSNYTDLFDFSGTDGSVPEGDLTLSGNTFYGATSAGGTHNNGVIFSVDTLGGNYTVLLNFDSLNGKWPIGKLVLSGNTLFGMTEYGGAYNSGVIFSIQTNGGGYKDLHDFNPTNTGLPEGSLTISGNKLYGETVGIGGSFGNIFSIDTNGNQYTTLYLFNGINGIGNASSLTLANGILYGTESKNFGSIFSIDTNGSSFTSLFSFNNNDGNHHHGFLTLSGDTFYGMTRTGGTFRDGVVFSCFVSSVLASINQSHQPASSVAVWPNPNNGIFTIAFVGVQNFVSGTVEIYNVMGQCVSKQILRSAQDDKVMDLSAQPNGVYFYRVLAENGGLIGEGKVVIQK